MAYFTDNGADQLIAASLCSGDVVVVNRRCESLPPLSGVLCWLSKFGISGDGRECWDHAALVIRDEATDVPYLLEGTSRGVTLRTYEERLMQGGDLAQVTLHPLVGERDTAALQTFLREELKMSKSADGFDAGPGGCPSDRCWNLWSVYRSHRLGEEPRRVPKHPPAVAAPATPAAAQACGFGAPLVATALQRLGVLGPQVDPASLKPADLPVQRLLGAAKFGPTVTIRR